MKTKNTILKNQFKKLGTAGLVNSSCIGFFHEVKVPKNLKNMQSTLLKTK